MMTYSAHGKFLLTGEYLVLHGALALAVPTKLGQTMTVETVHAPSLQWDAYQPDGPWFSAEFNGNTFEILHTDDQPKAQKLAQILKAVRQMNPSAFESGLRFETHLDFDPQWGLGSSSTLIANLAQWAGIDPYRLLKATFGGSGYDIACATASQPIFYRLEDGKPTVRPADFDPPFAGQLFFIYQGNKQQSSKEVAGFIQRTKETDLGDAIQAVSEISKALPGLTTLEDFQQAVNQHEVIIARCLDRVPVKSQYPDFEGSLKSLGAWGGDFILAATQWPFDKVKSFFHRHGLDTVFHYHELINHQIA